MTDNTMMNGCSGLSMEMERYNSVDEARNEAVHVTISPTASDKKSDMRVKKAEPRFSSVADVEEYRRSSSSTRRSSASWPEQTPDPIRPMARYSAAYTLEEIDDLSSSQRCHEEVSQLVDEIMNGTKLVDMGDGRQGLRNNQALLYDRPNHMTSMPKCKNDESSSEPKNHNESKSEQKYRNGRRRSSYLGDLEATILFVDLEGYSKTTNLTQRHITRAFMNTLSNLLTFCYGTLPSRANVNDYVILPTGDGAAVVVIRPPARRVLYDTEDEAAAAAEVEHNAADISSSHATFSVLPSKKGRLSGLHCSSCSRKSLLTTEETALWIGSSLLLWAESLQIGLRVGLNSGELSIVEDPYGDPNVCGDAINMAARIMDTALPGQILSSTETVQKLQSSHKSCGNYDFLCSKCPNMNYEVASKPSEVVVKHGVTTNVQSITAELYPLPKDEPEAGAEEDDSRSDYKLASDVKDGAGRRSSFASIGEQIPAHPLAEIKANQKKQSFASLSSLQPSTSFSGSIKKQNHSVPMNSQLTSDVFMLKRSSAENATKQATMTNVAASSSSTSNETWARTPNNNLANINSSTNADRRSTITTTESSKTVALPCMNLPFAVGNHKTPVTKWYMKVKPTEMKADSGRIKPKVLPQELIRRHERIAFIGIMHDNLAKAFINILEDDPLHRWDKVFVLFPSDECLKNTLVQNYSSQPAEKLIGNKLVCRSALYQLLSPVVNDLRFLQYDQLMHCGSYWDWCDPGGFIHVSPLTWGANPKTCPAMNYYWNSKVPSPEYRVYREGLEYLLKVATPF